MTKVAYTNNSLYFNTKQTSKYLDYLDYWDGYFINPSSDDTLIKLSSKYNKRPDLLSFELYGTPQLWWVFMLRNPDVIKDPINDFVTNITIYTPGSNSVKRFI